MKFSEFSLLGFVVSVCATPIVHEDTFPASLLEARAATPCYPETMPTGTPVSSCPKKTSLDKNGHCSSGINTMPGNNGCASYCEQTIELVLGREVPFEGAQCQNNTGCSITVGTSVTYTNTYSVNIGFSGSKRDEDAALLNTRDDDASIFEAAFDIGASYSYSVSISYSTTVTWSQDPAPNKCGYYTFVPYLITSCGVLTEASISTSSGGYYSENTIETCNTKDLSDNKNYCNTTPYVGSNGKADGKVVFVLTDCVTGKPLPTGQDQAYEYPGVSSAPTS